MKRIAVVFISCLSFLQAFSQFPLPTIMPLGVHGIAFGDTLLNTPAILRREGIRKITAVETSTQQRRKGISFTTTYHVNKGKIESRRWCYQPAPDTAFRFCTLDTLLYNSRGQLQEYRAADATGVPFAIAHPVYGEQGEVAYTWIRKDPQRSAPDTSTNRLYYNAKGQLVRQRYDPAESNGINAEFFYNDDGLPDSIRHDNTVRGTYVFNRKKKGKHTELTLDGLNAVNKWLYNSSGQCIASETLFKYPTRMPGRDVEKFFSKVKYAYNENGTLLKVVARSPNNKTTTVYSYEK
jgi:hypothetical protein